MAKFGWLLWFGFLVGNLHFVAEHTVPNSDRYGDPFWLHIPKEIRKVLTLGQDAIYSDYLFLWSIQEATNQPRPASEQERLFRSYKNIAKERIPFEAYYMMACYDVTLDYKRPELCSDITLEGLKAFPGSWRIIMTQAYIETYETLDIAAGAALYRLASTHEWAPPWVARLASKLESRPEITEQDRRRIKRLMQDIPGFLNPNLNPDSSQ